jgi:biotin synthase
MLVKIKGTPLAEAPDLDNFEFVRTIAVARILMPTSFVRLSAGRQEMNDEMQALCFMAGANSIFYGERLLTTDNPEASHDMQLFERLGIHPLDPREEASDETHEQALVSQVVATQSAQQGLYYDAMQSRTAKQVLPAADHGTSI